MSDVSDDALDAALDVEADEERNEELDDQLDDQRDDQRDDDVPDDLLLALGDRISEPDMASADAARAMLGEEVERYGRLGELAVWWAGVREHAAARPPSRVLLAGGGTDVAARRPGVRALALPRGADVDTALAWGTETADRAADDGTELICLVLDDHAPWRALAADLLAMDAVEASGWPGDRGMSDETWMDSVVQLRDTLRRLRGLRPEPSAMLRALGSPTVAAAAGVLVGATARRTPVVLDGAGAAAVGLLGVRTTYAAPRWWLAAHQGDDRLHDRILGSLGLEPVTRLNVRVADGTASLAALSLLDAAVSLLSPAPDDDPTVVAPDDTTGV